MDEDNMQDLISLTVVPSSVDADEVHFQVKFSTSMGNLKQSYAESAGVPISTFCFLFDGRRINDEDTPEKLKMDDGDIIEVRELFLEGQYVLVY